MTGLCSGEFCFHLRDKEVARLDKPHGRLSEPEPEPEPDGHHGSTGGQDVNHRIFVYAFYLNNASAWHPRIRLLYRRR
jgi:hypothetical protein